MDLVWLHSSPRRVPRNSIHIKASVPSPDLSDDTLLNYLPVTVVFEDIDKQTDHIFFTEKSRGPAAF